MTKPKTTAKAAEAAAEAQHEQPMTGGAFVRLPDGSLQRDADTHQIEIEEDRLEPAVEAAPPAIVIDQQPTVEG